MFNSKQKEIDKLKARCVELIQQLRKSKLENKQLKKLRLEWIRNNTDMLNINREQNKILHEIATITTQNTYGSIENNYRKIKELSKNFEVHR